MQKDRAHLIHTKYHSHFQRNMLTTIINCLAPCCTSSMPFSHTETFCTLYGCLSSGVFSSNSAIINKQINLYCRKPNRMQVSCYFHPVPFTYGGLFMREPIKIVQPFGGNHHICALAVSVNIPLGILVKAPLGY